MNSTDEIKRYFDIWRDKTRKNINIDVQKIIYMKLIKNVYSNISKNSIRKGLNKWKDAIRKIKHDLEDAKRAMDLLRKVITQPVFETFRTKIVQIEKIKTKKTESNKRLTSLLKHLFRTRKKTDLSKYINRWRKKALDNVKEKQIKTSLLVNVAKHQNWKDKEKALNRLREVLLKWRIRVTPTEPETYEKLQDISSGVDKLHSSLKKPHREVIFNEIKERKKTVGAPKILNKIITSFLPRANNNVLRRYLLRWKDRLYDDTRAVRRASKCINKLVDNLLKNPDVIKKIKKNFKLPYLNPFKDLPRVFKEIYDAKNKMAQRIINFFRRIKPKKNIKINNRNEVLKKRFIKLDQPDNLRKNFIKWYRIVKKIIAKEKTVIIINFLRHIVKKVTKKNINYEKFTKLIRLYIIKKVFYRFTDEGKNKPKYDILKKIIKKNDEPDKKRLKDAINKWKNLIPGLKKNDAARRIQSVIRGMRARKNKNKYHKSLNNLKDLYNKKDHNTNDLLRSYLIKWLIHAKRKTIDNNLKKIQKFLKIKVVTHIKITKENTKIKDLFKKLLLKMIIKNLKHITKTDKDTKNFDDLFKILTKIILSKALDKLMKNSVPQEKVTKLRKVYPKVKKSQKQYYLPIYLNRWKTYAIDKRDKNVKTIQDFLKNHVHQKTIIKKVITKQKKDNNLKTFVIKKSDNKMVCKRKKKNIK